MIRQRLDGIDESTAETIGNLIHTVISSGRLDMVGAGVAAAAVDPDTNLFFRGGLEGTVLFLSSVALFDVRFPDIE